MAGSLPARRAFTHEGRTVYEWEQGYDEVSVYLALPAGVSRRDVVAKIKTLPEEQRKAVEADIDAAYASRPALAMV